MKICLFVCFTASLIFTCAPKKIITEQQPPAQEQTPANGKIIHFIWKPNAFKEDFHPEELQTYSGIPFSISSCEDIRDDKNTIGQFTDISTHDSTPFVTKVNIANWCRTNFTNALSFLQIKGGSKGSITLECELRSFSIKDDQSLHGEIELGIVAKIKNDILVWEGSIKGASDLYSKPAGSDGFSECLSNTLISTVYNLLNEPSFKDAITKSDL